MRMPSFKHGISTRPRLLAAVLVVLAVGVAAAVAARPTDWSPAVSGQAPVAAALDDLAVWNEALLVGRLIKRKTLDQAWTPYKLNDGTDTRYGYAWVVTDYEGHRMIEHGGGINGFASDGIFFPESETKFFLKVVDGQVEFVKDATGKVTGMVMTQSGRTIPGKKIKRLTE